MPARVGNAARLIYWMTREKPERSKTTQIWSRMKNDMYLSKQTRLKGIVMFTEQDVRSVMRLVLFMQVFGPEALPVNEDTLDAVLRTGELPRDPVPRAARPLTQIEYRELLDSLFGENFSRVTRHSFVRIWREYETTWRYVEYGTRIYTVSARDLWLLYDFVNADRKRTSLLVRQLKRETFDFRVLLQNKEKRLKYVDSL